MVKASNGREYIATAFTEDMVGLVIPDQWVVKPSNGRFWDDTRENFEKCTNGDPTYGLCRKCFGSGPVALHCQKCRVPGRYYCTLMCDVIKAVDTTWVSRLFETSHVDAMADRIWNGRYGPYFSCDMRDIEVFLNNKYLNHEDRERLIREDKEHFRRGISFKKGVGAWDCLDRRANVTYIHPTRNVYTG
jgi:hypothetical protein